MSVMVMSLWSNWGTKRKVATGLMLWRRRLSPNTGLPVPGTAVKIGGLPCPPGGKTRLSQGTGENRGRVFGKPLHGIVVGSPLEILNPVHGEGLRITRSLPGGESARRDVPRCPQDILVHQIHVVLIVGGNVPAGVRGPVLRVPEPVFPIEPVSRVFRHAVVVQGRPDGPFRDIVQHEAILRLRPVSPPRHGVQGERCVAPPVDGPVVRQLDRIPTRGTVRKCRQQESALPRELDGKCRPGKPKDGDAPDFERDIPGYGIAVDRHIRSADSEFPVRFGFARTGRKLPLPDEKGTLPRFLDPLARDLVVVRADPYPPVIQHTELAS